MSEQKQTKEPKTLPANWMELEYLTVQEVAILLRVSVKTICRWVDADASMPALKIGRKICFPRERLLRWVRVREQGNGRRTRFSEPLLSHPKPIETKENASHRTGLCAQA